MVNFTDDEKNSLKERFKNNHPEIEEKDLEQKFSEYLQDNGDALRKELDETQEITVDENISEAKEDDGWKKELREAVKKANTDLKQEFEEYKDEEHPEHLFFKDKKNDKNIIAFASKSEGYVEGEQAAFDELVKTAQNMGKEIVNFGKFEKHPEYKALLYLACLKFGMKMKNAPEIEELKEYPEYKEIKRIDLKGKLKASKEALNSSLDVAKEDAEYMYLKEAATHARKAFDTNKLDENKVALDDFEKKLKENKTYQNIEQKKKAYHDTLKDAADFYIEHGFAKTDRKEDAQKRKAKLENHVKSDEHGIAEQGDARNTYAQERLVIKEVLSRRNSR